MSHYPTGEAWSYFLKHHDNIRSIVEDYGRIASFEVPNTRTEPAAVSMVEGVVTEQRGLLPLKIKYVIETFDLAVKEKDSSVLYDIMNDAWLRAPKNTGVYRIDGFSEMCNLLDFTVEGFVDDNPPEFKDDEGNRIR